MQHATITTAAAAASMSGPELRGLAFIRDNAPAEAHTIPGVKDGRFKLRTFDQQGLITLGIRGWKLTPAGAAALALYDGSIATQPARALRFNWHVAEGGGSVITDGHLDREVITFDRSIRLAVVLAALDDLNERERIGVA